MVMAFLLNNRFRKIPVFRLFGMGPTKTLAKLANFAAKKWPKTNGVVDLSCPQRRERLMRGLPVNEVWGIGSRLTQQLAEIGITTVWALAQQPAQRMQAQFSVVLARTIMELNGISCLELAEIAPDKQEIMCSRSFKRPLDNLMELSEALAEFCSRAAEKRASEHSDSIACKDWLSDCVQNLTAIVYQLLRHLHWLSPIQMRA